MFTTANLLEWVSNNSSEGIFSYLLVDLAQADKAYAWLRKRKLTNISLFERTPEEHLVDIAPTLIPIGHLSADSIRKVCDWAIDLAYRAPCLCWMASQLSLDELAAHLRKFHVVALSDGQAMMLRWYDTRVLPVWFACMTPSQAAQFTTGLLNIHYINRAGVASTIPYPPLENATPDCTQIQAPLLRLTDQQFGMLLDASEIDMLVSHLRRVITDETNKISTWDLFKFVAQYQQCAVGSGLDDLDRQTQYILLAFYTSGRAMEHPKFVDFMRHPPGGLNDFHSGLLALPEDVWTMGRPFWIPVDGHDISSQFNS